MQRSLRTLSNKPSRWQRAIHSKSVCRVKAVKQTTIIQIHDGAERLHRITSCNLEFPWSGFLPETPQYQANSVRAFVCVCVSCRAPSANVSVTCYKLALLLPWTPSAEKYKWVTKKKKAERGRGERKARQTERGRWRWGGGQGEPLHEYKRCFSFSLCQTCDLCCLQRLMKTYGVCVSVCTCG